jgi:hypothetical protein
MNALRPVWALLAVVVLACSSAVTGIYLAKLAQPELSVAAQDNDSEMAVDLSTLHRPSPLGPPAQ